MVRTYNDIAFEDTLKFDGDLTRFWKYDRNGTLEYDATTQIPVTTGTIISEYADMLNVTKTDIDRSGNKINADSKKLILSNGSGLQVGDAIINSNNVEIYKIIFDFDLSNRDQFGVEIIEENGTEH